MTLRPCLALLCVALVTTATAAEPVIWRLDDPARLGGHPLTVWGTPKVESNPAEAGMVFNGSADGIFLSANPLAGAAAFTIEVLFKPAEGGLAEQRFFHLQDKAEWRVMLETRLDGQGRWWLDTFLGKPGVSQPLIDPTKTHPTDRWYWVALRFDGKRMTNFVNGVQELEREATFGPLVDADLSIGVRQNKVFWFKGTIREVRWHREAIAADKLQKPSTP
jgi:hypothetical protein